MSVLVFTVHTSIVLKIYMLGTPKLSLDGVNTLHCVTKVEFLLLLKKRVFGRAKKTSGKNPFSVKTALTRLTKLFSHPFRRNGWLSITLCVCIFTESRVALSRVEYS